MMYGTMSLKEFKTDTFLTFYYAKYTAQNADRIASCRWFHLPVNSCHCQIYHFNSHYNSRISSTILWEKITQRRKRFRVCEKRALRRLREPKRHRTAPWFSHFTSSASLGLKSQPGIRNLLITALDWVWILATFQASCSLYETLRFPSAFRLP